MSLRPRVVSRPHCSGQVENDCECVASFGVNMNDDLIIPLQCRSDAIHDLRRSGVIAAPEMQHERAADARCGVQKIVNSCAVITYGGIGISVRHGKIGDRPAEAKSDNANLSVTFRPASQLGYHCL